MPIKRTIAWKAGSKLTKGQVDANRQLSGMNQQFYVNQILLLMDNDLIDPSDLLMLERLKLLHERLTQFLAEPSQEMAIAA
jgi:hypothetical protein